MGCSKIAVIIYRSRGRPFGTKEISNHAHLLKAHFPIIKRITPCYLHNQELAVVAAIMYNYIRQEALNDRLFEKYNNNKMIVVIAIMRTRKTKHWLDLCRHTSTIR